MNPKNIPTKMIPPPLPKRALRGEEGEEQNKTLLPSPQIKLGFGGGGGLAVPK